MAQFGIYQNRNAATAKLYPYVIDLQTDLLSALKTTVVAPVCAAQAYAGQRLKDLCPQIDIGGEPHLVLIHQLAGVDRAVLGRDCGSATQHRSALISAIDFLLSGV
jgi:toxin CcdB